jgi:hypothetical protein
MNLPRDKLDLRRLEGLMRYAAVAVLLLTGVARAEDFSFIWIDYSKWERLPEAGRMMYLAGAFDSLTGFSVGHASDRMVVHYSKCMSNSGMNLQQFSGHVAAYAQTRPDLQGQTMQVVMGNYLGALCGLPPH